MLSQETYEESRLNESDIGDKNKWLKEGMDCNVLTWNGRVCFHVMSYMSCMSLQKWLKERLDCNVLVWN